MAPASAEMTWKRVDFISGIVTAAELNVRKGPSTKYSIIGTLKKTNGSMDAGEINGWYVIFEPNTGLVGCVSGKYLQPPNKISQTPGSGTPSVSNPKATPAPTPVPQTSLSQDEKEVLDLINAERAKAGLPALKADPQLMEVARLKAKDMG